MKTIRTFLLWSLSLTPLLAYQDFETQVSWESFGPSGPQAPRINSVSWRASDDFTRLAVRNPDSGELVMLSYLGTRVNGATTGAMFAAKLADGRRVSVTLMRKGDGFTYSVTVTSGAREHMVYGKGNFNLLRCYVAQQ
jgi:hypothetical protein